MGYGFFLSLVIFFKKGFRVLERSRVVYDIFRFRGVWNFFFVYESRFFGG